MKTTKTLEIEKVNAIVEEVEASFTFIIEGIRILNNKKSAVLNNHVELQLFSSGFERLAKILLFLKEKYITGQYPELEGKKNFFGKYDRGHGIKSMIEELILYSETVEFMNKVPMVVEDLLFIKNDFRFNKFLEILTDFSIHQRYYYIDTIAKKEIQGNNSFQEFKTLIDTYSDDIDVKRMTYDEEEKFIIKSFIITIEKGVRAIARFFTHGLGDEGKMFYGDFGTFFMMDDENLGERKYLIPKREPQKDYSPWKRYNLEYLKIKAFSKSRVISSSNYDAWPFLVKSVEVINYKNGLFCLVKIDNSIFALNGSAVGKFKIPVYFASKQLKPRQNASFLLNIAQQL